MKDLILFVNFTSRLRPSTKIIAVFFMMFHHNTRMSEHANDADNPQSNMQEGMSVSELLLQSIVSDLEARGLVFESGNDLLMELQAIFVEADAPVPNVSVDRDHPLVLVPEDDQKYKCPLSQEIMDEPVMMDDGQWYEKLYILNYIDTWKQSMEAMTGLHATPKSPITRNRFGSLEYKQDSVFTAESRAAKARHETACQEQGQQRAPSQAANGSSCAPIVID